MLEIRTTADRLIRRLLTRSGLMAATLAALLVLSAVFVASSEGVGLFNVNGKVVKIRVDYSEPCNPGTFVSGDGLANPSIIDTDQNPSRGNPLLITTSAGIGNCLEVDAPPPTPPAGGRLLIADSNPELFFYTTITARTTVYVTSSPSDPDTSHYYEGTIGLETFPVGQSPADWPNNFPTSGQAYIGAELVNFTRTGTTFTIASGGRGQGGTAVANHLIGSLVRLQGRLKLIKRNGREYVGYNNALEPTTGIFSHSAGATLRSPKLQLSCRALLLQATQVGNDSVTSRSRCYAVVEPGVPWGDEPVARDAILPLIPGFYHEISNGTLNVFKSPTQNLTLTTDYLGITCFPYIEGSLWSKITSTLSLDSNFAIGTSDDGQFRITLYGDDTCEAPLAGDPLGSNDSLSGKGSGINERVTQLDPADSGTDTDLDGCSDARELTLTVGTGGIRDPLNMWDYFNPANNSGNGTADITAVVTHYGRLPGDPLYGARWDRGGAIPGANSWNFRPPNGNINTGDITAAVNSYGHNCPAPTYTGIGKMPDAINSTNLSGYILQAIPMGASTGVDWPNAFPAGGQAHLGGELVSYTRIGTAFTITARGQGGTTATSHLAGTVVWIP